MGNEASGFFYGEFVSKVDDKTSNYQVFLVTNGHVIQNHNEILIRLNPRAAGRAKEYPVPLHRSTRQIGLVCAP